MKGKCYYCNNEFSKSGILRHLKSCRERKKYLTTIAVNSKSDIDKYILVAETPHSSTYWMYISINSNAQLRDLDQFIRDVWVECCGHLSSFKINGEYYESTTDFEDNWMNSKDMNIKLKNVIDVGDKMDYEYDFGSTTYLRIRVVDKELSPNTGKQIELMARNNEPPIKCSECGRKAFYYDCENEEYLCENCAENFSGDEEMLEKLDYENSPRDHVCGYYGDKDNEKPYLPKLPDDKKKATS
ncbi:hypothetical protein ACFHWD_11725 [Clostridium sp. MT-14]|uniref:IS1096 element passenger TnpR family protein n=1 Tax=unclassified Clostridium TaxID=2614128 RepID=UPI00123B0B63|nr:plasmid pRiA4b ORF-3 family protein [Clostridium sp. HV4-5-A1G]KAA8680569.1 plasmid pRiA4b ORF-3 family protein [Clostridium sp. HV4-5-A1G]